MSKVKFKYLYFDKVIECETWESEKTVQDVVYSLLTRLELN